MVVTDGSGNSMYTVIIVEQGTEVNDIGTASAVDLVDGPLGVSNDAPGTFSLGTTVVTWMATDAAGIHRYGNSERNRSRYNSAP